MLVCGQNADPARYLTVVPRSMTVWLILTGGHCPLRRVNVMCVDLFSASISKSSFVLVVQHYASLLGVVGLLQYLTEL